MKATMCSKSELALRYLPNIERRSAVNRLMQWVKHNKTLCEELDRTGYYPTQKYLSPLQVQLIIQYLGEPD